MPLSNLRAREYIFFISKAISQAKETTRETATNVVTVQPEPECREHKGAGTVWQTGCGKNCTTDPAYQIVSHVALEKLFSHLTRTL